jgi:hypothetical protein
MCGQADDSAYSPHSRQVLQGYEQKPHRGRLFPASVRQNAKPNRKMGVELGVELMLRQLTLLFGRYVSVPCSKACLKTGAIEATRFARTEISIELIRNLATGSMYFIENWIIRCRYRAHFQPSLLACRLPEWESRGR